jgi:hypothetical protein
VQQCGHSEDCQRLAVLDCLIQQRYPAMLTADGLKVASAYWRADAASADVHDSELRLHECMQSEAQTGVRVPSEDNC